MPNLYIIAGCNGAGKTTASYTVLPEMLDCKEFVNADNIAAGISPFNPDAVAFESGRVMLHRINELLAEQKDFALETTLSTRSYVSLVKTAQEKGYKVTLLYFWLNSPQMAKERVATRVQKGGHHIPDDVVERRYYRGISNLFKLFIPICDVWLLVDNSMKDMNIVARGEKGIEWEIKNSDIWGIIQKLSDEA